MRLPVRAVGRLRFAACALVAVAGLTSDVAPSPAYAAAAPLPAEAGIGLAVGVGAPLDGPGIAYVTTRVDGATDIATMAPDGSGKYRVTDDPANDDEPTWSPGGRMIALASDRAGTRDLFVMDVDGSNVRQVTFGESPAHPRWSPRGADIAYLSSQAASLRVVDVQSGDVRRLHVGSSVSGFAWSPEGTRIAYNTSSGSSGGYEEATVNLVDVDGANVVELARAAGNFGLNGFAYSTPLWERDAAFLRYAGLTTWRGINGSVRAKGWRVSVQGIQRAGGASAVPMAMSPDGQNLVAMWPFFDPASPASLHVVGADGSETVRMGYVWSPTGVEWSPDGSQVVYGNSGSIFLFDPAAGVSREVERAGASHPTWRPAPGLPPNPLPSLAVVSPRADEVLPTDAAHVDITVRFLAYDGPWQWRLDSPFPFEGQGGGEQVDDGAVARVGGLGAGRWHTVHLAPVGPTGLLLQPVFRMSGQFRVASPAPSSSLEETLIAYVNRADGEIYVAPPDGDSHRRVTTDQAGKRGVCWSPDGLQMAYSSNALGSYDIWVMGRDGSRHTRVTDDGADETYPAWSPDGTRIAYTRATDDSRSVYAVRVRDLSTTVLTGSGVVAGHASWSPDGARIAVSLRGGDDLGMLTLKTGALQALPGVGVGGAAWSPIGGPLLVLRGVSTERYDLPVYTVYTVHPDGGHALPLPIPMEGFGRTWSPDGSMIAVGGPGGGIFLAMADGAGRRHLPGAEKDSRSPAWSPFVAATPTADEPPPVARALPTSPTPSQMGPHFRTNSGMPPTLR